jgi:tricorn protease
MKLRVFGVVFLLTALVSTTALAIDITNTKFLSQPAISGDHIAFVYANDLWVADRSGDHPRQLTSDQGLESNPVFSPDGRWIAFNAQYDGNTDVYIVSVYGGIPKRLTWHPYSDNICSFTPDGSAVLLRSDRHVFTRRYDQLFAVPVEGGIPERLELPNAYKATYSPDGTRLAYTPLGEPFRQWKNYRGGTATTIWLYTFSDHGTEKIPQPEDRSNDTDPMWIGDTVYFRSDRNGEFNLFAFDTGSKEIVQLTRYTEFPIVGASAGKGTIVFEQAGTIHTYDIASGEISDLAIGVAADLKELRPRYVDGSDFLRSANVSPSGSRAVFEMRGEIVTAPAKKGDPRNLTQTPGTHERGPAWSPDGKSVAYFSDASGEYELHIAPQDGKGEVKAYPLDGTGFYNGLSWSPDSKKLAFEDNGRNLYVIVLSNGEIRTIDREPIYNAGPFGNMEPVWSPDSAWLAYTVNNMSNMEQVHLYSMDQDDVFTITDGLSDVGNPAFDASGKYLYLFGSTDAGPVRQWFAMSSADMEMSRNLYLVTLQKDVPSPLAKESDEEEGADEDESEEENGDGEEKKDDDGDDEPMTVDFDDMGERILTIPVDAGNYFSLQAGAADTIFYLEAQVDAGGPSSKGTKLMMYDLAEREEKELFEANAFVVSADGKKILYNSGETWGIVDAGEKPEKGKGTVDLDAVQIRIDPAAEWAQIFDETWRIYRDYFYASNYHGVDWPAMRERYEPFLPDLACRTDLNRLIRWMGSELAVGHNRVGGGDTLLDSEEIPGGLLGADFTVENGRYRITKVFGGLNWNPELTSPLTEPGVDVKAGQYLLAVGGVELVPPDNLYRHFENTAGKIVEITVGPNPEMAGSRTVNVVPVETEYALRNRDWVEGNIKKVDKATDGRVAYVYLPNTTTLGHTYFKRYFFPQVHKDAIIVDERFNGGGQIADYYINILQRPYISHWNMRDGFDMKTPQGSIQGPKVMLIDETAGSGGDLLPYMFRKFELGKLIGKATWGGLVGTLGFPRLIDGGYVTAPNVAIWDEDGWVVENVGVPPDIEVEQTPAEVIAGRDPQLEKAIEVILEELEANPPPVYERPPYPVRVRQD